MANYIAIIELHEAGNEEDFEQLDAAMEERQFSPQIRDDEGKAYWMPEGSYAIQNTEMVLKAAHDAAVGAAGESGFDFSIMVTSFEECEWTNLTPVEESEAK
ncbi:MAG TPA: hypothetical protein VMH20_11775 [Verrucomicrobiae bacterium]|nr:hypothetical protein [Verrucomicrobiae bacterium]